MTKVKPHPDVVAAGYGVGDRVVRDGRAGEITAFTRRGACVYVLFDGNKAATPVHIELLTREASAA